MDPGAEWELPRQTANALDEEQSDSSDVHRSLYFYRGNTLNLSGTEVNSNSVIELNPGLETSIVAGDTPAYLLFLQGRPIGEPVANHGPFAMNTPEELAQAVKDYQQTEYGGWPWPSRKQVHPSQEGRFAKHADGRRETHTL